MSSMLKTFILIGLLTASLSYKPLDGMIPGKGYSYDCEAISSSVCFEVKHDYRNVRSDIDLTSSLTMDELYSKLGIKASAKIDISDIGASASTDILNEAKETDASISLNYMHRIYRDVNVNYLGYGDDALTEDGKNILEYDFENFGVLCGEKVITSYEEGAFLLVTLKVEFTSSVQKKEFMVGFNVKALSYAELLFKIEQKSKTSNFKAKIKVTGRQLGGDSLAFNSYMASISFGNNCSFQKMSDCLKYGEKIIDYAKNNFPKQFQVPNPVFSPLTRFRDENLAIVGIDDTISKLTPEIEAIREDLGGVIVDSKNYLERISVWKAYFPTKMTEINEIEKILKANLALLTENHSQTAVNQCWTDMDFDTQCGPFYKKIKSKINRTYKEKIALLTKQLEDIRLSEFKGLNGFRFEFSVKQGTNFCLKKGNLWESDETFIIEYNPLSSSKLTVNGKPISSIAITPSKIILDPSLSISKDMIAHLEITFKIREYNTPTDVMFECFQLGDEHNDWIFFQDNFSGLAIRY